MKAEEKPMHFALAREGCNKVHRVNLLRHDPRTLPNDDIEGNSDVSTSQADAFTAYHRHGFVRVATCTPRVRPADVTFNRDSLLEEMRRADAARVDLLVCPELSLSSYAIDDLHMQDALLNAVEEALGFLIE
ncbi:MAG: hypothetical protein ABJ079_00240, partial [Marinomonas sp.]